MPINMDLSAANKSPISIEGAFFAVISTTSHNGTSVSCRSMVYVSSGVQALYLSYETLLALGILAEHFPYPPDSEASCSVDTPHDTPSINAIRFMNDGCDKSRAPDTTCSCPQRGPTPQRPSKLPLAWLLDRYASSTFNTCPHRALPSMEGPPIEIHVDPAAPPKACHTPASVPLHWQQKVHEDLLRDEALGVIERVP